MTFSMLLAFLITSILPVMHTPISLGLWIILMAMFITISFSYFLTSWFSFITFLIYIGGLLVMFAYFIAIDPNKKIKMLDPMILPLILTINLFYFVYLSLSTLINFSGASTPNTSMLIHIQYMPILMLMASSLLIALIVVVKITMRTMGTLRPYS